MNLTQYARLPEFQSHDRMAVIPLIGPEPGPKEKNYLPLVDALQQKLIEVTEISEHGSVPDLAVINRAQLAVLLLDGEEVAGAKQNRVLNTSILAPPGAKTIIPVSCSEHGRWHYKSEAFQSSGNLMSKRIRSRKSESVSASVHFSGTYHSNQSEVWNEIDALHCDLDTSQASATGAMSDAFDARAGDLDGIAGKFPLLPLQRGIAVFLNGRLEGLDYVSRPSAYARLHDRLIRSYAVDVLRRSRATADAATLTPEAAAAAFEKFLADAQACQSTPHPSPGLGEDQRLTSPTIVGSALRWDGELIHLALFHREPPRDGAPDAEAPPPPLASLRRRRESRSPFFIRQEPGCEEPNSPPPDENEDSS